MSKQTGHCLCGAVKVTVEAELSQVDICHCSMCRRWAGGPYFAMDCKSALTFTGEDKIKRYRSSDWAERAFCSECGTNLFYRLVEPDHYVLSAGLFDDQSAFHLEGQIFIDEKPAYYDFANKTKSMTGAEVFALYAPKT